MKYFRYCHLYLGHGPLSPREGPDGPAPTQSRQGPDGPAPTQSRQGPDGPVPTQSRQRAGGEGRCAPCDCVGRAAQFNGPLPCAHTVAPRGPRRLGLLTLVLSTLGLAVGCALLEPQTTPINRDVYRALPPPQQEVPPRHEGSLFSGENGRNMFFVDRKARSVNDVLTVRIADVTRATGQADTNTSRTSSAAGSLEGLFGFERTLRSNNITPGSALAAQLRAGFDSRGTTTRRNSLSATVTAVVREVFPNGNLFVEGSKEVIINNERQYITVTGVVRPEDIGPDNSISSDLLADARLVYSGRGVLSDKQRPGWLGRIFDFVWPF